MMRLSLKLAKEPCTHHFSTRLFRRPLPRAFGTATEAPFEISLCRGELLPVLFQDPAVCKFASRTALPRASGGLAKWSSLCTNPRRGPHLLSKGSHTFSVYAKKGESLRHVHVCQHRYSHSACQPIVACSNEKYVVLKRTGSFSSCELNGENKNAQRSSEASFSDSQEAVCTQSQVGKELDTRLASSTNIRICKRFKNIPEAAHARLKLDLCSKTADLRGALEIFDQVKREQQVRFDLYAYNILLYLCSGAASGRLLQDSRGKKRTSKTTIQDGENPGKVLKGEEDSNSSKVWVHFSPEDIELGVTRGPDILEDMLQQGVEPNEATYTSIVRLAVAKNDGDLAFETIKLMESSGIPPKLRSYGPLLLSLCECNNADKAYEVDDHMLSLGIQPDESMLDSLLKLSTQAGCEDKIYALLHRLRKSLRDLLPTTVQSIENWFTSEHAAFAGKARWKSLPSKEELRRAMMACGGGCHNLGWLGMGAWQVRRTSISKTGSCLSCGESLCAIDLDIKDTEDFAKCVVELACKFENSPHFSTFQDWLDEHGPFDAIIDGANVGLYNPKIYNGLDVSLLQAVVNEASARFCTSKPPLVLLHSRHRRKIAQFSSSNTFLNEKRKEYAVYFTPLGSNDDWFWLYAAVKCKCMLVSNDQMRDHTFALLGNNFFPKWKERHQVRFTFTGKSLEILMPPPYATIIQESQNGSWHVPQTLQIGDDESEARREWLCVTRSGAFSQV